MIEAVARENLLVTPNRNYGLGVRGEKLFPAGTQTTRALLGARRVGAWSGGVDYSAFVDFIRNQLNTSACVGFALARILHVRSQILKFGLTSPNPSAVPYPSEGGIYKLAREEDSPNADTALADEGSDPVSAFAALTQDIGTPLERDLPFDPATINDRVPPEVLARALAMKVGSVYVVDSLGQQRVEEALQVLDSFGPFSAAVQVGDNYEAGQTDPTVAIQPEPADGKIYGGHEIAFLGARVNPKTGRREFLNPGSWGTGWSLSGWAWLDEGWISDPRTTNVRATDAVPDYSLSAAQKEARK